MRSHYIATFLPSLWLAVSARNFAYEQVQLTENDVVSNPDIQFLSKHGSPSSNCKTFPEDPKWPSTARWAAFNASLGGVLIKTIAPGSPCYPEQSNFSPTQCANVVADFPTLAYHTSNPSSVMADWLSGSTCTPTVDATGTCSLGGYPVYVVNATSVKHVQAAVNFARNNNIRLIVKNTGHDFLGRSAGAGAISVWTHHLKGFEYLSDFKIGKYRGKAARLGAGTQSYDMFTHMSAKNITMVAPQDLSLGVIGGYMQGGGHSYLGSKYGLMSDQVLSVQLVTADGKFLTADPTQNQDLFFAVRGGGGSTFGIVTSAIIKAHPAVSMATTAFELTTSNTNVTTGLPNEVFWKIIRVWFADLGRISDHKGFSFQWINVNAPNDFNNLTTYTFTNAYYFPDAAATTVKQILAPLYTKLNAAGASLPTSPNVTSHATYGDMFAGIPVTGRTVGPRFISRLWPRTHLETPKLLDKTMKSVRKFVEEGGYTYHCVAYTPTDEVAGYPGTSSAVNPAFRKSVMHVTGFDFQMFTGDAEYQKQRAARLNSFAQPMRDITPESGAYSNEVDISEPNWERSLYGSHWKRLSEIKKEVDPAMVFYARHGVGSERWEVITPNDLPTQNGRLCKVGTTPS